MTSTLPPDVEADRLASEADRLFQDGSHEAAAAMYGRAAAITARAAPNARGERTRALLMSNAVVLWFKARRFDEAERLAYQYMLGDVSPALRRRLREVIFECWQDRDLPHEDYATLYEVHLFGGDVKFGLAPSDETSKREDGSQALLWRAAEYHAGQPMRPRGAPAPHIQKLAQLYSAVPMPGSYRLRFKVRSPWRQQPLTSELASPEDQIVSGEPLVHKAVSLVQLIAQGSDDELAIAVPDPVYRAGFMKLVREMAPDGRRVEQVDIAGGRTRLQSTSLTVQTRERVRRALQGVFEQAGWQRARGKLTGIQVRGETKLKLTVDVGAGPARKYEGPIDLMESLGIGALFNRQVVVAGRVERSPGGRERVLLEHIEPDDDDLAATAGAP
jgi:hypothetical protein